MFSNLKVAHNQVERQQLYLTLADISTPGSLAPRMSMPSEVNGSRSGVHSMTDGLVAPRMFEMIAQPPMKRRSSLPQGCCARMSEQVRQKSTPQGLQRRQARSPKPYEALLIRSWLAEERSFVQQDRMRRAAPCLPTSDLYADEDYNFLRMTHGSTSCRLCNALPCRPYGSQACCGTAASNLLGKKHGAEFHLWVEGQSV